MLRSTDVDLLTAFDFIVSSLLEQNDFFHAIFVCEHVGFKG